MSTIQEPTPALIFKEVPSSDPDKPVKRAFYELTGDPVAVWFEIVHNNKKFALDIGTHPYAAERLARMLQDRAIVEKPADDERGAVDLDRGSLDVERSFFDEHFAYARLNGKENITLEQLAQIDAWSNIKARYVNIGLNGIHTVIEETDGDLAELLDAGDPCIRHFVGLSDGSTEHRVDLAHYHRHPSAEMGLKFRRASKIRTTRGGSQKVVTDHLALRDIYKALINRIDGMLIKGEPCVENNKDLWTPKVPLFIQLDVVTQIFRDSQRKN